MPRSLAILAAVVTATACAAARSRPPATYAELAARCGVTRPALDSMLTEGARSARRAGVELPPATLALMLATTLPEDGDCSEHAAFLSHTVRQQ